MPRQRLRVNHLTEGRRGLTLHGSAPLHAIGTQHQNGNGHACPLFATGTQSRNRPVQVFIRDTAPEEANGSPLDVTGTQRQNWQM